MPSLTKRWLNSPGLLPAQHKVTIMLDRIRFLSGRTGLAALLSSLALGCASTAPTVPTNTVAVSGVLESHCAPEASAVRPSHTKNDEPEETGPAATPGKEGAPSLLSPRAQQMARIIGIDTLVEHIRMLQDDANRDVEGAQIRLLKTRRQLSDRLLLALIETGSLSAELDCERARAEELAVRLEEVQNDIQHSRTIRAIVGEASLQMAAGVLLIAGLPEIAGGAQIAGNANALGHGVAALGGEQQTDLVQTRNLLGEVWEGPEEPTLFPSSVWRYLTQPAKDPGAGTRRDTILSVWRGRLGATDSELGNGFLELYFGKGGTYHVPELRHRADMLAMLKAFVNLMNQDLNLLFRETLTVLNRLERD
jgi:hypothetical protein